VACVRCSGSDAEHMLEVSASQDEDPVEHSAPALRTERSAKAFALGAGTGVRISANLAR